MSHEIAHFMWGYQEHFRISEEVRAERLFQLLDPRFSPEVFLVGVLEHSSPDQYRACVEPEEDFWIPSEAFNDVLAGVRAMVSSYPESRLEQSLPLAQESQDNRLFRRGVRDSILSVVADWPRKPEGMTYFASYPTRVGRYLVALVIGLQRHVIDSYYTLSRNAVPLHEYREMPAPGSLIFATVEEFLREASDELLKPDAGADLVSRREAEELIRSAGSELMRGIAHRADRATIEGTYNLFRACNTIASLRYESASGCGRILLARRDHPVVQHSLSFSRSVRLRDYRGARKLLELATGGRALHANANEIFGLGDIGGYNSEGEDLFEIEILEHHCWEIKHAGECLMRVSYGQPQLPLLPFNEGKLRLDLARIFDGVTDAQVENIIELVRQAEKARKGTILVIAENAASEAKRLQGQCTPVEGRSLTPELLSDLITIDGAVLMEPDGGCYAIGAILDGMASGVGDPSRGARYNSALRYVQSSESACLAIVVSEDGGVDFVPDLPPAIRRSSIDEAVGNLRAIAEGGGINRRRYAQIVEWLERTRFYLLKEDCDAVNELLEVIENRLSEDHPDAPRIVRRPFTRSSEMDPDLYYVAEE